MRDYATTAPRRAAPIGFGLLALVLCATLALAPAADAKKIKGTGGNDQIAGTKKKDTIKAKGGDDRVNGRKGNDKIKGAKGADTLKGGKGKDSIAGGADNDQLLAVDGSKDRKINGGSGDDTCVIDQVDLGVVSACETLQAKGDAPAGSLELTSASGVVCASELPTCTFEFEGTGAEALVGTAIGGGGVTLGGGPTVSIQDDDWTAVGVYGCTDDGFITVEIGAESIDVPITCQTEPAEAPVPTP